MTGCILSVLTTNLRLLSASILLTEPAIFSVQHRHLGLRSSTKTVYFLVLSLRILEHLEKSRRPFSIPGGKSHINLFFYY